MSKFDCLSDVITTADSVSNYVLMARIPMWKSGTLTHGAKYHLRFVELSSNMFSTDIKIFTSNSSAVIYAWYTGNTPKLRVIINNETDYWGVYVKPTGLYTVPIGMKIIEAQNPANIIPINGMKPIYAENTLSSPVTIGVEMNYCKETHITLGSDPNTGASNLITSPSRLRYNYTCSYNANNSTLAQICPDNLQGVWLITYIEGSATNDNQAWQTWESIISGVYHKYIRYKADTSAWGDFIQIN